MRCVVIESPYAGDIERNTAYARRCMLDSLRRDEAPFLGHLLYTQILDDNEPKHREIGIDAHCAWIRMADRLAVYIDYGISKGMREAIMAASRVDGPLIVQFREIGENP